jgi:hypothetical protein
MKTIEKERIIPAETIKDTVYVAEDGTEFDNYGECSYYEYNYKIEKDFLSIKHKKVNFNSSYPPYYDWVALAFYLSNETEAKFLFDYYYNKRQLTNTLEDEFYDGEGWYIVAPAPKGRNNNDTFYIIFSVKLKHSLDNEFMNQFDE